MIAWENSRHLARSLEPSQNDVWVTLRSLLGRRFARAQVATSWKVGCFLRLPLWTRKLVGRPTQISNGKKLRPQTSLLSRRGNTLNFKVFKSTGKIQAFARFMWGGTGGREAGRKGGGRCTGGGRRGGGKRDSQGGGKREKKGKITQHCATFRNRKNAKGREPKNTGREPGLKGTGSGRIKPPCPPPRYRNTDYHTTTPF